MRPDHSLYDAHYHDTKESGSRNAADAILALTLQVIDVATVLDVGCGYGSWLAAARELGVSDLTGIEGPWAAQWRDRGVLVTDFDLLLMDLEIPFTLDRRFDLVICQEVAEHLTSSRADAFIAELCAASSRAVVFGAAIPGQGGPNHVNERWTTEWAARFAEHGFRPLDVFRRRIWNRNEVPVYYRQNALLFVDAAAFGDAEERLRQLPSAPAAAALDVVHPYYYEREIKKRAALPGVSELLRATAGIPAAVARSLRFRLTRWR